MANEVAMDVKSPRPDAWWFDTPVKLIRYHGMWCTIELLESSPRGYPSGKVICVDDVHISQRTPIIKRRPVESVERRPQ